MAERLGMLQSEMMERMPAFEFMEWMALETLEANGSSEKPAQSPEEILAMFTPTDTNG